MRTVMVHGMISVMLIASLAATPCWAADGQERQWNCKAPVQVKRSLELQSLNRVKEEVVRLVAEAGQDVLAAGLDFTGAFHLEPATAAFANRHGVRAVFDLGVCLQGRLLSKLNGSLSKEAAAGFRARQYVEDGLAGLISQKLIRQANNAEGSVPARIDWYGQQVNEFERLGNQAVLEKSGG